MKLEKEVNICSVYNAHGFSTLDLERIFTEKEIDIIRKMSFKRVKLILEVEQPILDLAEREYLRYVIKPFRNDSLIITKKTSQIYNKKEYIIIFTNNCTLKFPPFKKGKMYKGMKVNKKYSVKELGL